MRRRRLAALLAAAIAVVAALAGPGVARAADTQVMYRLYNQWSGEHLYTASASERDALAGLGWTKEGEGWVAPAKSSTPVYRLYNPYAPQGDHHYTTSKGEYDRLAEIGWRQEGVGWYSDDDKGVELHRLFNPYALSCTHHYTASAEERDALVKIGWRYEGTAWYGVDAGSSGGANGYEYVLRSGVTQLEDYTPTGDTSFKVPSSQGDLKVGDKVVLEATEENPFGAAGTITAVTKNSNGTVSVTFKQATDPSEVFYSLEATQRDVKIDSSMAEVEGAASGAGGVSAEDSWTPSGGAIGDGFNIKLDNSGSYVKGNFSVKPTIGYDVKWTLFGGLERCVLELEGDASINAQAHVQNKNAGKDVKILEAKVPIAYGFSVDIPLYVHVSLEGDLTASVDYQMDTTVRLDDGEWVSKDNSTFTTELSAAIHMRLGGKVGAELKWLEVQLVDAAVDAGADGTAKTTVRETGLTCSDLNAYAYLGVEVGTGTNYLVKLGWTLDKDLVNEKNSPLKLAWHFEDGERVPECTYGKDGEKPGGPEGPSGDVQVGTDPDFDGMPFLTDEGWGTEPIWQEDEDGDAELAEPFYINAGTSVTIKTSKDYSASLMFGIDGNTVYRTKTQTNAQLSTGVLMHPDSLNDDDFITIEVLVGRVKVWSIHCSGEGAWRSQIPSVTFDTCETEEFPLELSQYSLTMHVGDTFKLEASQSVTDLYNKHGFEYDGKKVWTWSEDDWRIATADVDDNEMAATITARAPGETYIRVRFGTTIGGNANHFERICKVTVVE